MTDNLVLIAEDDRDVRDLLAFAVESAGYRTVAVQDGKAAARLLTTARPLALITDVKMPSMNGMDLCRLARSSPENWNTAILMISASIHARDVDAGLNAGADGYLPKPFTPKRIVAALQQVLSARPYQTAPPVPDFLPGAFKLA
jgi:two-component system OmpR family response regulator